jgi:hypothetical protein
MNGVVSSASQPESRLCLEAMCAMELLVVDLEKLYALLPLLRIAV